MEIRTQSHNVLTNPTPDMGVGLPTPPSSATPVAVATAAPRKLNLSGMAPPVKLGEARLEDLTIDGICGVY